MSDRPSRLAGLAGWRERAARTPVWVQWLLVAVLLLAVSGWLTTRFVYTHTALSPIDEYSYVDAVDKASRGVVVREGDMVDEMARQAISCRGFGFEESATKTVGRCGVAEPDEVYPWGGHTTAGIHSPVFYFLTAWLARAIMWLAPGLSLITAARLTGGLWLALGALVLAYLLRRTGARWDVSVLLPVAVISMPGFRATNGYVSPDSLNLLAGAAVFLAAVLYARREWGVVPLVLVSAVVTLVKFQNCFAVVAAFLFLLWHKVAGLARRPDEDAPGAAAPDPATAAGRGVPPGTAWWARGARGQGRSRPVGGWLALLLPPVVAVGAGVAWMRVQQAIGTPTTQHHTDPEGSADLASSLFYLDDTLEGIFTGNWSLSTESSVIPSLGTWFAVAALCATAWFLPGTSRCRRAFAQAGVVSLLGIGPAVNLAFALVFGSEVAMQPRYGMVLIPILALPTAWVVSRRSLRVALALFAVTAYAYAVINLRVN